MKGMYKIMRTNSATCNTNCEHGLIDLSGICDPSDVSEIISVFPYWKQTYITENLTIPPFKPEAEQINSLIVSVDIIRAEVIVTPSSEVGTPPVLVPNLEGRVLTGRKVIIEGQLCQKIQYTANLPEQSVHNVEFFVPFSSFIVVPREIIFTDASGVITVVDSLNVNFEVSACIEDISACLNTERDILKQVTLLVYAVPTQA
jgi:hypothetical protein